MKKHILLGVVMFLLALPIPYVIGADRTEYLSPYAWTNFSLTLTEGFKLNWEFETYNSSFQALVRIDDPDGYFENLITAESGSGVYVTTKEGKYTITLLNPGSVGGYIRFTYSEPTHAIPSFIPLLVIGIIITSVVIKGLNPNNRKKSKLSSLKS